MSLWTLDDGRKIRLLTIEELYKLPNGTELWTISGKRIEKNPDLDLDVRFGRLAYGPLVGEPPAEPEPPAGSLKDGDAVQVFDGDGRKHA